MILNTAYTAAAIYDPDTGLTPTQLEYLAAGVVQQQNRALARELQGWVAAGPLLATAVGYGMSGNPAGFNAALEAIRVSARELLGGEVTEKADAPPAKPTRGQKQAVVLATAGHHPLFLVNLGKPVV